MNCSFRAMVYLSFHQIPSKYRLRRLQMNAPLKQNFTLSFRFSLSRCFEVGSPRETRKELRGRVSG